MLNVWLFKVVFYFKVVPFSKKIDAAIITRSCKMANYKEPNSSPLTDVTMLENVNASLKNENALLVQSYKDLFNEFLAVNTCADELEKVKTDLENKTKELAQMVEEKNRWRMWCFSLMESNDADAYSSDSSPPYTPPGC